MYKLEFKQWKPLPILTQYVVGEGGGIIVPVLPSSATTIKALEYPLGFFSQKPLSTLEANFIPP
jgi:hypothetical protein